MKLNHTENILVVIIGYRYVKNNTCKVAKIKVFKNEKHGITSKVDNHSIKFMQSMTNRTYTDKSITPEWEELYENELPIQKYPLST